MEQNFSMFFHLPEGKLKDLPKSDLWRLITPYEQVSLMASESPHCQRANRELFSCVSSEKSVLSPSNTRYSARMFHYNTLPCSFAMRLTEGCSGGNSVNKIPLGWIFSRRYRFSSHQFHESLISRSTH